MRVWTIASGKIADEFSVRSWALGLRFSDSSRHLAAADFDFGDLHVRDPSRTKTVAFYPGLVPQAQDFCFLDSDSRLAAVSRFDFRLIDPTTGHEVFRQDLVTFSSDYIFHPQVLVSPDGRQILMNQSDATVRILGQPANREKLLQVQ